MDPLIGLDVAKGKIQVGIAQGFKFYKKPNTGKNRNWAYEIFTYLVSYETTERIIGLPTPISPANILYHGSLLEYHTRSENGLLSKPVTIKVL
jgi:hypothetical protein